MSKAYQDGGKWWVPWTGTGIVPSGAEFRMPRYGPEWGPSNNHNIGVGPSPNCEYRIPATQDEIDVALRAESPKPAIPESASEAVNTYAPWIEKSWGRTRQVFAAEGVEVWESEGKAGHRTSWHCHPHHSQTVIPISGDVFVNDGELRANAESWPEVDANEAHDVRFETDCRFLEHYQRVTGTGSVMDTLEEIYR